MGPTPEEPSSVAEELETYLETLSLGKAQIAKQTLPQLKRSLRDINELIARPTAVPGANIKMKLWVADLGSNAADRALNALLRRRADIETRIDELQAQDRVVAIEGQISAVEDPNARKQLEAQLNEARSELRQLKDDAKLVEQRRAERAAQAEYEKERNARLERRTLLYKTWIERESIASLVGSLLLVGFGVSIVVAMFNGTTVTEILSNAFLLILGYFFGQSTASKGGSKDDKPVAAE